MQGIAGLLIDRTRAGGGPLQIPEAIGVELVRQASLAETAISGAFDTLPLTRQGFLKLVRPPTHQGRWDRGRQSSSATMYPDGTESVRQC